MATNRRIVGIVLILALVASSIPLSWGVSDEVIAPEKLREDVDFLFKNLEEIHPNLYAYTDKSVIDELRSDLNYRLDHPMTRIEFYKEVAPVVAALNDGHTHIYPPFKEKTRYAEAGGLYFPLDICIFDGDKTIAERDYSGSGIPIGSELLSVNGILAKEILESLRRYVSAEREAFANACIERRFREYLWVGYGPCDIFLVEVKTPEGMAKELELHGMTHVAIKVAMSEEEKEWKPYEYTYLEEYKCGLLTFNPFIYTEAVVPFLHDVFLDLKQRKAENLIIDIIENRGGSSRVGDLLLSYLTDKPFRQYSRMDTKVSEQIKKREVYSDWRKLQRAPNGTILSVKIDYVRPRWNPLRFDGNVWLLTSAYTFSSATAFAATIQDFKLGAIAGEETGGLATTYGDVCRFTLPNSGREVGVSYKYCVRPNGQDAGRGVIPDYEIAPRPEDIISGEDRMMMFVLDMIEMEG